MYRLIVMNSMTNFIDFARNSFVNFCEKLIAENAERGMICYKNDCNRIIYADRFGTAYKLSIGDGEVKQVELKYPAPSDLILNHDAVTWLRSICFKKNWRGGNKKLDSYLATECPADLDKRGIDPYFYAWMASRHYEPTENSVKVVNEINLTNDEYVRVCQLVSIQSNGDSNDEDVALAVIGLCNAKSNGYTFDGWVSGITTNNEDGNEMFKEISAFVDKWADGDFDLKHEIFDLVSERNAAHGN